MVNKSIFPKKISDKILCFIFVERSSRQPMNMNGKQTVVKNTGITSDAEQTVRDGHLCLLIVSSPHAHQLLPVPPQQRQQRIHLPEGNDQLPPRPSHFGRQYPNSSMKRKQRPPPAGNYTQPPRSTTASGFAEPHESSSPRRTGAIATASPRLSSTMPGRRSTMNRGRPYQSSTAPRFSNMA